MQTRVGIIFTMRAALKDREIKTGRNNVNGITLIELMVSMAVASIIVAVIFSTYQIQQRSYVTQQLVVDMQQNARVAMALLKREIRMAGYDPNETSGAKIELADEVQIHITADISADGDVLDKNEDIIYSLTGSDLMRQDGAAAAQIVAYNIEAIGFAYAYDEDLDGQMDTFDGTTATPLIWAIPQNPVNTKLGKYLDTDQNGVIDADDTAGGVNLPGQVDFDKIRMVKIWLLAKTSEPIRGHRDNRTYVVGDQHISVNDRFKRCLLTATVHCRNMGI